jgi:hypothetical protein
MVADVEQVRRHLDSDKYKRLQRTATADFEKYKVRACRVQSTYVLIDGVQRRWCVSS